MTSKLKCPFCGQELIREGMNHWWCSCNIEHQGKELYGTTALWQALIQAKQDLEILKQALEKYADEDMWENCCIWDVEYIQGLFLEHGYKIAKEALEQINRKQD